MAKTLKEQLAEAKDKIVKLEVENVRLAARDELPTGIHGLLDASVEELRNNQFYMRGVKSDDILSLVMMARDRLRVATKL